MEKSTSCGGVVVHKGKVLLLYKNSSDKYIGWILPKGTMELGEKQEETALREVQEETSSKCKIEEYINKTGYTFKSRNIIVKKTVYWFLMSTSSFYSKPQIEEHFYDSGFYKEHEAYHMLKFKDEKEIMKKGFEKYRKLKEHKKYNKDYKGEL